MNFVIRLSEMMFLTVPSGHQKPRTKRHIPGEFSPPDLTIVLSIFSWSMRNLKSVFPATTLGLFMPSKCRHVPPRRVSHLSLFTVMEFQPSFGSHILPCESKMDAPFPMPINCA